MQLPFDGNKYFDYAFPSVVLALPGLVPLLFAKGKQQLKVVMGGFLFAHSFAVQFMFAYRNRGVECSGWVWGLLATVGIVELIALAIGYWVLRTKAEDAIHETIYLVAALVFLAVAHGVLIGEQWHRYPS